MNEDPFFLLESNKGWSVAYCDKGLPRGGRQWLERGDPRVDRKCNWTAIADFTQWLDAIEFIKRLRG